MLNRADAIGARMSRRLRAVDVPHDQARDYHKMIGWYDAAMVLQARVAEALKVGDEARAKRLSRAERTIGDRGDAIAMRLRLDHCAKDGDE
jgi:hypothetical protein